ncbi:MAG: 4-(cytidine 5'-diphospho)-2-C-methyl-D-erythritol kinase [Proteobacteria bacterium]|nr:4-(cytidine 5'-diphospho)-2-C-methyl-D-erythritol kinase [Pseudomonadota bacterium]
MRLDRRIEFRTPAKVNFYLYVQRKRADGYHELLMDLIPVSLFDMIALHPSKGEGLELESDMDGISPEENLVVKAVRLLEDKIGQRFSLKIVLHKTIPAGAGLGGGSGNAAGILVVMNRLFDLNFSERHLREMALTLGADVPFFIHPQPSIARGIGEALSPLPDFAPLHLLLAFPNLSISTAEAYSVCNLSGRKNTISGYAPTELKNLVPQMNDFWEPLVQRYPVLERCRRGLIREKALSAGISGSGSTLFGIFPEQKTRDQAYSNMNSKGDWTLFCCETLGDYRYLS